MNYIGSKYTLLPQIARILDDHSIDGQGIALDLFAGTGAVAQLLKQRGHITYANDWQHYAYLTTLSLVGLNDWPTFERLLSDPAWQVRIEQAPPVKIWAYAIDVRKKQLADRPCTQVLRYLAALPGRRGPFYEAYCQGGRDERLYFEQHNGQRIQAIRDQIAAWQREEWIDDREAAWLIACLIESADRVANTASIYGAYLKHIKRTAAKPLRLLALRPMSSPHSVESHHLFSQDGLTLLQKLRPTPLKLVYIDPPYNHRQYAANYHILETLARWDLDQFEPRGVTGLRPAETQRSDYCLRTRVKNAFQTLFEHVHADYLLFSYNNEGLLEQEVLKKLFEERCSQVDFRIMPFRRFRADVDRENRVYKTNRTQEFLVLGKPR